MSKGLRSDLNKLPSAKDKKNKASKKEEKGKKDKGWKNSCVKILQPGLSDNLEGWGGVGDGRGVL